MMSQTNLLFVYKGVAPGLQLEWLALGLVLRILHLALCYFCAVAVG